MNKRVSLIFAFALVLVFLIIPMFVSSAIATPPSCIDSDGDNPNRFGWVDAGTSTFTDFCYSQNTKVKEYICVGDVLSYKDYTCANGCDGGKCLPASSDSCEIQKTECTKTFTKTFTLSDQSCDNINPNQKCNTLCQSEIACEGDDPALSNCGGTPTNAYANQGNSIGCVRSTLFCSCSATNVQYQKEVPGGSGETNNSDSCIDSDGGNYPLAAGYVSYGGNAFPDKCVTANVLTEYYCNSSGIGVPNTNGCPNGGNCLTNPQGEGYCEGSIGNPDSCTDSDANIPNPHFVKGSTFGYLNDNYYLNNDSCSGSVLTELGCEGGYETSDSYTCPFGGCSNGACISPYTCEPNSGICTIPSQGCAAGYVETTEYTCKYNDLCCIKSSGGGTPNNYIGNWINTASQAITNYNANEAQMDARHNKVGINIKKINSYTDNSGKDITAKATYSGGGTTASNMKVTIYELDSYSKSGGNGDIFNTNAFLSILGRIVGNVVNGIQDYNFITIRHNVTTLPGVMKDGKTTIWWTMDKDQITSATGYEDNYKFIFKMDYNGTKKTFSDKILNVHMDWTSGGGTSTIQKTWLDKDKKTVITSKTMNWDDLPTGLPSNNGNGGDSTTKSTLTGGVIIGDSYLPTDTSTSTGTGTNPNKNLLYMNASGVPTGKTIHFKVYEKDSGSDDLIRDGTIYTNADSNKNAVAPIFVNRQDIIKSRDEESVNQNGDLNLLLYFKVYYTDNTGKNIYLDVGTDSNSKDQGILALTIHFDVTSGGGNDTGGGIYLSNANGIWKDKDLLEEISSITYVQNGENKVSAYVNGINTSAVGKTAKFFIWESDRPYDETGESSGGSTTDGQYQTAVTGDGQVYVSSDYGNNFVLKLDGATGDSLPVAMSYDGKYQTVTKDNQYVYFSDDYGDTWSAKDKSDFWNAFAISISGDGKYQTVLANLMMYSSSDYGNTWVETEHGSFIPSISLSGDGKYQTLVENSPSEENTKGRIRVSNNYGSTWQIRGPLQSWTSIDISDDGEYQLACADEGIYVSSDYGNTWSKKEGLSGYTASISGDGKYQMVLDSSLQGNVYVSSDYGNTWSKTFSLYMASWIGASISRTGQYQVIVQDMFGGGENDYYYSDDYGQTWTGRNNLEDYMGIAISKGSSTSGDDSSSTGTIAGTPNDPIYLDDGLWSTLVQVGYSQIRTTGETYYPWEITQDNLQKGGPEEDGKYEFYFGVKIDNDSKIFRTKILNVQSNYTGEPICGNGICEEGEDSTICPEDCDLGGGNDECLNVNYCSDHLTQSMCETPCPGVIENEIELNSNVDCSDPLIDCDCAWVDNECAFAYNQKSSHDIGSCTYITGDVIENCLNTGTLTINYKALWTWNPDNCYTTESDCLNASSENFGSSCIERSNGTSSNSTCWSETNSDYTTCADYQDTMDCSAGSGTDGNGGSITGGNINKWYKQTWFLIVLGAVIIVLIFLILLVLSRKKERVDKEKRLFNNKNNLYNLMNYINNVKRRGMSDSDVKQNLRKSGWTPEQIGYAMRKYSGKKFGLFKK